MREKTARSTTPAYWSITPRRAMIVKATVPPKASTQSRPERVHQAVPQAGDRSGPATLTRAARLISPKARTASGGATMARPVWPRVTRTIIPRVKTPTAPTVRAWSADDPATSPRCANPDSTSPRINHR
jgi:hypothetical protein